VTNLNQASHSRSLNAYAYEAIATHLQTVIQHEADVLADTDPEAIHQMRVGLRRLRTTLEVYGRVLKLPKAGQEKRIKKLARVLGKVRDIDVLQKRLSEQYRSHLPKSEQKKLDNMLRHLHQQRKSDYSKLKKTFKGKPYRQFKLAYVQWLNEPCYTPLAAYTIEQVLPDLLLPLMGELMLHPGWLAGQTLHPDLTESTDLSHWLDQEGIILHSLRKQIKRVRYQTEFLMPFYSSAYKKHVEKISTIQGVLGQIQDCWVLNQTLIEIVGKKWQHRLPTLAAKLQGDRQELWKSWYPLQQQYLDSEVRNELRLLIAQPQAPQTESSRSDL